MMMMMMKKKKKKKKKGEEEERLHSFVLRQRNKIRKRKRDVRPSSSSSFLTHLLDGTIRHPLVGKPRVGGRVGHECFRREAAVGALHFARRADGGVLVQHVEDPLGSRAGIREDHKRHLARRGRRRLADHVCRDGDLHAARLEVPGLGHDRVHRARVLPGLVRAAPVECARGLELADGAVAAMRVLVEGMGEYGP